MTNFDGKRIYVSGPMTGKKDYNRQEFAEVTRFLRNQGAEVFNPAFATKGLDRPHEAFMVRDLHQLTEHMDGKPYYDYIAQLPGWEKSPGAKLEYIVAQACGIRAVEV